jgi:3-dehydroquinate dehydratase/shikimate dehydrogenase
MEKATIVAVIDREIAPAAAAWAEVPMDVDVRRVRAHFAGKVLVSVRHALVNEADYVDFQPDDLVPHVLDAIPPHKRVISWYGRATDLTRLASFVTPLLQHRATLYRVVVDAQNYTEALLPLQLLKSLGRRDVIAWADGPIGMWTRLLAPQFGAPFVFSANVPQLIADYGFPQIVKLREIFGIAGNPVLGSLSPRLHNAAFREIGRPALYVPFHVPDFEDFWSAAIASGALDALGLPISAICVVSPHKEAAIASASKHTPMVRRAHSTNFFVREDNVWTADTTDPGSVIVALHERGVDIAGHPMAVVGCGGSGRAIAAALQQAGAHVTLVNRSRERGSFAGGLLGLPCVPLAGFSAERYSVVVNATPVGRDGQGVPFATERMRDDAVVVDLAYGAQPTPLISRIRARGRMAIDGRDILMRQAMRQFHIMTGQEMPQSVLEVVT